MMKKILIVLCLLSASVRAGDHTARGESWFDFNPSKEKLLALLCLSIFPDQALADNCTNSSSGPYTDFQIQAFTWFQIGTGIFASVLILNNFYAAYYFYARHEKDVAKLLEKHIAEIKEENAMLKENKQKSERIVGQIRKLLIRYNNEL